jgi:hypothetical protein
LQNHLSAINCFKIIKGYVLPTGDVFKGGGLLNEFYAFLMFETWQNNHELPAKGFTSTSD